MTINILMPALSPTMKTGNLSKWFKSVGDNVEPGEILAEIETDKATMEIEAVDSGTLGEIIVPDRSENISVNTVIGIILEDDEKFDDIESDDTKKLPVDIGPTIAHRKLGGSVVSEYKATPIAKRIAENKGIELSTISGSGGRGKITRSDLDNSFEQDGHSEIVVGLNSTVTNGGRIFSSPLARRLAAEAEIDIASIKGSGPMGRIIKQDVEQAGKEIIQQQDLGIPVGSKTLDDVQMSSMRKVIAERMIHAKSTVPHFYLTVDCEIDELVKVIASLNNRFESKKLSINDFIIRASALALIEVPEANVSWLGEGKMRFYKTADISVAVSLEDGLVTPIIFNAEQKGLAEISAIMKNLAERGRAGELKPEEYQGGSFTISNLGMFGIKQFDAVINEPQACILAVGAGEKRPIVRDDVIVPATIMTCTLSCDHRVVDGVIGAKLLTAIKRFLEYPPEMLL